MCVIYDLSYLEMTLDVDELDILDIQVGQKAEITADAISDRTFEGVGTSISSAGTTSGGTTTYPVTIRIDDTGSLMPGKGKRSPLQHRFRRLPDPASYSHILQWLFLRECSLPGGSRLYAPDF